MQGVVTSPPPASALRTGPAYLVALALSALAMAVWHALVVSLPSPQPLAVFYLAVALAAWWCGLGPAILAALLGGVLGAYYDLESAPSSSPHALPALLVYLGVCTSLVAMLHRVRRAEGDASGKVALLTGLAESVPDGILIVSSDGRILFANQEFARSFEMPPAILASGSDEAALAWAEGKVADPVAFRARVAADYRAGVAAHSELPMRDGRILERHGAPVVFRGARYGWVWTFRDVTVNRRITAELQESEARFRAVADNIPQLAWMTDATGEALWVNRRWEEHTGLDVQALRARGWQEVHHPDQAAAIRAGWLAALRSGTPWEHTLLLRGRDGTFAWTLARAFPIRDTTGRITRWFGTNTDVSQQKQVESTLRETIAALSASERALAAARDEREQHAAALEATVARRTAELTESIHQLEAFSYSLSHDLRAPLRAMMGYTQILQEDYADRLGPEGAAHLERIKRAAGRLDQLVQDVLAYSRAARGPLALRAVDLDALVRQLLEESPALRLPAAQVDVGSPLLPVLGDEASLSQVVSNLVYNAVKFTRAGERPRVRIWTEASGEEVCLSVADEGIGIPKEAQERIFGLFSRLHPDERYPGTGLGLAIARKAVERMGGRVEVSSEPDRGSVFRVWLRAP